MQSSSKRGFEAHRGRPADGVRPAGFGLIETLAAVLVLTFGLIAVGELIFSVVASTTLARSMETASVAAQSEVERLADLFRQDPSAADLTLGGHGPRAVEFLNPSSGAVLNRFSVTWSVTSVPGPRAGRTSRARQVTVTVTPVDESGRVRRRARLNKEVVIAGIFSPRVP